MYLIMAVLIFMTAMFAYRVGWDTGADWVMNEDKIAGIVP